MSTITRFAELIEQVAAGQIDAGLALKRLEEPEWQDPAAWELKTMNNAYHLLQHFHIDADIRDKDERYARSLVKRLKAYAEKLRAADSAGK